MGDPLPKRSVSAWLRARLGPAPGPPRRYFAAHWGANAGAASQQLAPGGTAECATCGTALLLVSGPPVMLRCHGRTMSAARPVRCSELGAPRDTGGLTAGEEYLDMATWSTLRCTRSGSGWPVSRAGALLSVWR